MGHYQSHSTKLNSSLLSELVNNHPPIIFPIGSVNQKNPILGDPALIHPFLAGLGKDRNSTRDNETDLGAAALHLAIRCASGAPLATMLPPLSSFHRRSRNGLASTLPQVHFTECCSPSSVRNNRASSGCLAWSG